MTRSWQPIRAATFAAALFLAGAAGAADLVETAQDTKTGRYKLDHFGIALEVSGLVDSQKAGSYTVFAPTNQAFRRLDLGTLKPGGPALSPEERIRTADKERLVEALEEHVVQGALSYSELARKETLTTLGGTTLEVVRTEGGVLINDVTIVKPDLTADNGVIHVVEALLAGGKQR